MIWDTRNWVEVHGHPFVLYTYVLLSTFRFQEDHRSSKRSKENDGKWPKWDGNAGKRSDVIVRYESDFWKVETRSRGPWSFLCSPDFDNGWEPRYIWFWLIVRSSRRLIGPALPAWGKELSGYSIFTRGVLNSFPAAPPISYVMPPITPDKIDFNETLGTCSRGSLRGKKNRDSRWSGRLEWPRSSCPFFSTRSDYRRAGVLRISLGCLQHGRPFSKLRSSAWLIKFRVWASSSSRTARGCVILSTRTRVSTGRWIFNRLAEVGTVAEWPKSIKPTVIFHEEIFAQLSVR